MELAKLQQNIHSYISPGSEYVHILDNYLFYCKPLALINKIFYQFQHYKKFMYSLIHKKSAFDEPIFFPHFYFLTTFDALRGHLEQSLGSVKGME